MAGVFAVRHRIGYYLQNGKRMAQEGKLMAVDLTSPERTSVVLALVKNLPSAQTDAGLIVWDGMRWVTVPWIKEWKDLTRRE